MTYKDATKDLELQSDPVLKASIIDQIHNFGQTPPQLFTQPHRRRDTKGFDATRRRTIYVECEKLQGKHLRTVAGRVGHMYIADSPPRILVVGLRCQLISVDRYISFATANDMPDSSLRIVAVEGDPNPNPNPIPDPDPDPNPNPTPKDRRS